MTRTLVWLALCAVYAAAFGGLTAVGSKAFDPMSPRGRTIERAIGEGRFADALPLNLELRQAYPQHPLPAYWMARIYHGLQRPSEEAAAWEAFIAVTSRPHEACPGWPAALETVGRPAAALAAFTRCTEFDQRDPERWLDLGDALNRAGEPGRADEAYRRGLLQDPLHSVLLDRIGAPPHEGEH